jgi:hypothetical protein
MTAKLQSFHFLGQTAHFLIAVFLGIQKCYICFSNKPANEKAFPILFVPVPRRMAQSHNKAIDSLGDFCGRPKTTSIRRRHSTPWPMPTKRSTQKMQDYALQALQLSQKYTIPHSRGRG